MNNLAPNEVSPLVGKGDAVRRRKRADLDSYMGYEVNELGHSQETGLTYCRLIRSGAEKLGKPEWDVTPADVRALMARQDLSWRWKSGYVSAVKSYRRWGRLEGFFSEDGFGALRAPKRRFAEDKAPVSEETARKLMEACEGSTEFRIIHLPLLQGLRLQEATLVESWSDRLKVYGKGGRIRYVPVHPEIDRLKSLILEVQPKTKATLRSAFKRVQKRVQARDIEGQIATPHSLRHTYSTHLTKKRVMKDYRMALMGHSRGTDGVYSDIPWEYLVEAENEVDYYSGEPVQLQLL